MTSQVQTSYVPQSYTESVPVTTYSQIVEETGGYTTRSIPVVSVVPVGDSYAGPSYGGYPVGYGGGGCGGGGCGLSGLFSKHAGGCGGGHKLCGGGCGGGGGGYFGGGGFGGGGLLSVGVGGGSAGCGGGYTTTTSYTTESVYVSRPVVRQIPQTSYVQQTRTQVVPVQPTIQVPDDQDRHWSR